jgi:hypothetical protein
MIVDRETFRSIGRSFPTDQRLAVANGYETPGKGIGSYAKAITYLPSGRLRDIRSFMRLRMLLNTRP